MMFIIFAFSWVVLPIGSSPGTSFALHQPSLSLAYLHPPMQHIFSISRTVMRNKPLGPQLCIRRSVKPAVDPNPHLIGPPHERRLVAQGFKEGREESKADQPFANVEPVEVSGNSGPNELSEVAEMTSAETASPRRLPADRGPQ
jgi:hypothetical protein